MSAGRRWRLLLQLGVVAVILAVLATTIKPSNFARAAADFPVLMVPVVVALTASFYILKGLRWHQLLRSEAVAIRPAASVLMSIAGEAFGLLPLGELARGELVTELTGAPIGTTVAAVTVQELLYTLVIVAFALPGSVAREDTLSAIAAALAGMTAVVLVLTVGPVYRRVLAVLRSLPGLRRIAGQVEILQRQTARLLRRSETWRWIVLSVGGAVIQVTLFWLVIAAATRQPITWGAAAFIYGAAYLAGAVSSPGGLGGFESTAIGLLSLHGITPGAAGAAAVIFRAADKGVITLSGLVAYLFVRRHFKRRRGLLLGGPVSAAPSPPPPE